jgi:hypothetical protein
MYFLLSLFVALAFAKAPLFLYDDSIEGQYIVIYHPFASDEQQKNHESLLGQNVFANYNITKDFMGYAAHMTKDEVELIRDDPIVSEVHIDTNVHLFGNNKLVIVHKIMQDLGVSADFLFGELLEVIL